MNYSRLLHFLQLRIVYIISSTWDSFEWMLVFGHRCLANFLK